MTAPLTVASFLAPSMKPVYQAVATALGKAVGRPGELITGTTFSQFANGGADVGFICGLPYVQLTRRPNPPVELLGAPVLAGERYAGKPIYFSDVIVRADAPYRSFADLRGTTWSYNDRHSHSGYNVTRAKLVSMGEIHGFFSQVIEAGSHEQSIRLLLAGKIDASAIDSQILSMELRDQPQLASQIKVIDVLGPATIQPVVAATTLPAETREKLRHALVTMHDDPQVKSALAHGFVERFVPVSDADYDGIRDMLTSAEDVGFYVVQ